MPSATPTIFSISRLRLDGLTRRSRAALARGREIWAEICADISRPRPRINWDGVPPPTDNPWRRYWGDSYGPDLKKWLLTPLFEELDSYGRIGDLVVDVGSGALPVTQLLKAKAGRRRILVDIAADNSRAADGQKIRLDAEKISQPEALSFRKAWLRVCKFLDMDPRSDANGGGADTIIFSDILNYVDFEKVLGGFAAYLKPGGRIIVSNLAMRGNQALFSGKGIKDNRHLYRFLEEHRFEIEHKSFPCRHRDATDEAEELILLVARKK